MLSLCPLTVLPCSPLDQIDAAFYAGFDAIGLRLVPTLATDIDVMADSSLRDAIRQRLRSAEIAVLDVEIVRLSPTTDVGALEPMLYFAADLGARSIMVTGVPINAARQEETDEMIAKLHELCHLAQGLGLGVTLEFMVFRTIATLADAIRIRDCVGLPNLTICIDALHLHRSGGTSADLAVLEPGTLSCFQICDGPAEAPEDYAKEARFGRLLPGHGELPLVDMLGALPRDVPIAVEVPGQFSIEKPAGEKALEAAIATRSILKSAGFSIA